MDPRHENSVFTCVLEGLDLGFAAGMPFEKFSRTETENKCALKVFAKCALEKTTTNFSWLLTNQLNQLTN